MTFAIQVLVVLSLSAPVLAQTASLRGQVTDQSGAVVPGATVSLSGSSGLAKTATADDGGSYSFVGLPPGDYQVQASAPDLVLPKAAKVTLKAGVQILNLQLKVVLQAQQVTVHENGSPTVSTDPAKNAGALVLRGTDLDALADDPEDLQADLLALAGPSAGPSGGAIFIDGFSGGELPPKESIREIRVNQNPFSPEYDKLGFGRIEIFTKPGTDKLHGSGFFNFAGDFWNSRNPYAMQKAPFLLKEYGGSLSGPVNKRASFFLDVQRHSIDNGSIINGTTLDPVTLAVINPFTDVFRTPQRRIIVNPRIDYQLDDRNTLTMRYGISRADIQGAGIGGFNLVSRGYHSTILSQNVQVAETAVLLASVVNEIRFQFFRVSAGMTSDSGDPAVLVLGSFYGGGAQVGQSLDVQNNYEFQDYASVVHGSHSWKFGIRLRGGSDDSTSPQNFGGTFVFAGGSAPELGPGDQPVLDSSGDPTLTQVTSIERYRRTLLFQRMGLTAAEIRALGGGAALFSINAGTPGVTASQIDVGAFVGDDWRVRPNITLSLGLRYETQTNIHDWSDLAPRIAFAWAPGAGKANEHPRTVVRGGFGLFYDRLSLSNTIAAQRFNGIAQQQFVVTNPDFFPTVPPIPQLQVQSSQTIQQVSPVLRAPYIMQSAVSVERQLPLNTTLAITYANAHGLHLLRSEDINAPLPGTFDPLVPGSGVLPLGRLGPVFQMQSSGLYNQNQLIVNINARVNTDVSLFGAYVLNRAMSNTDGLGTFPANPFNLDGEYGPAATDVRHRVTLNGSINLKWNVRISPFIIVDSGPPFDITVGRDLYGTTLFNARPGISTDANKPGLFLTRYGLLDPNPTPDEKILARNFGRGPGTITVNMRLAKAIGFGGTRDGSATSSGSGGGGPDRRGAGGVFGTGGQSPYSSPSAGRRYNLTVSMSIRNLLNHTNPGPIIGNITSPLFGQANQPSGAGGFFSEAANNRRLELQMRFSF